MRCLFISFVFLAAAATTTDHAKPSSSTIKSSSSTATLRESTLHKLQEGMRLNRSDRAEIKRAEQAKYLELRQSGIDEVSHTHEAVALRNYRLRNRKRTGFWFWKQQASISGMLYPHTSPREYDEHERVAILAGLVESRRSPVPYKFHDYYHFFPSNCTNGLPFDLQAKVNKGCTVIAPCARDDEGGGTNTNETWIIERKTVEQMKERILEQYRVQLFLDQLPVLMRSREYNYAVRGYPIGFQAPPSFSGLEDDEEGAYYLFNHLKFIITYEEDPGSFQGVRITGFDVHPVSVDYKKEGGSSCDGSNSVENDPASYLQLPPSSGEEQEALTVTYSYEVEWVETDLPWSDRWDVYILGMPDANLHPFSILCSSLLLVGFLMRLIGNMILRKLRKDSVVSENEMNNTNSSPPQDDENPATATTQSVKNNVSSPPQTLPMALAVLVANGAQLCMAFGLTLLAALFHLANPVEQGHLLTAFLLLYVLSGLVAGYISSRLYKFLDPESMAASSSFIGTSTISLTLMTTCPAGLLVALFGLLNGWLRTATTLGSNLEIFKVLIYWISVSAIVVHLGATMGFQAPTIQVPTEEYPVVLRAPFGDACRWVVRYSILLGGLLPMASVFVESSTFIAVLWDHVMYYDVGLVLAVMLILIVTCAQVSIVLTYFRLCVEGRRWWWPSFWQGASAGLYFFCFCLWFLADRLDLAGSLPVAIYLTYMGLISIFIGLGCGSIGFISSFVFVRYFIGAVNARGKATN